jgi:hypothetical protein
MDNNIFRPVEFWKASIMVLPDNAFFELLRSVVGKIKTPYNKQILLGDLEKFLQRDDIKKNISCYINDNDKRIIAAVAALDEPVPGNLESFFSGELSYAELHDIVINLEERFIIYRFFEDKQSHLALNPVLESVLLPFVNDSSLLFPSVCADEIPLDEGQQGSSLEFLFDDRVIAALLAYISQNKVFFKAGGGIRRKVFNSVKIAFPNLENSGLPLEMVIGGLQVLGLFFAEGETLVPDYNRYKAFGNLNRRERLIYWAAGILCCIEVSAPPGNENPVTFSPWMFRGKVRDYASIINNLFSSIDPKRLYPYTTLRKMIKGYANAESGSGIISIMEKTGLMVQVSDKYWRKGVFTQVSSKSKVPVIVMDTPFSFLAGPEIAYEDLIKLAAFSGIIEAGMTVRFELNRDSVIPAFDRGFTATGIIELLQRLSHNRIEESVIFTLGDWEKRHSEVTLRRGMVLTLSPEQRYLAETRPLAKLITETLAPGIYMLPESAEDKISEALKKAGVTIIAHGGGGRTKGEDYNDGALYNFYMPLDDLQPVPADPILPVNAKTHTETASTLLIEGFHSILKGMSLGEEERNELSARINRKLVLCESQLKGALVRYEKLEARGLDYAGKALIAKQAVALQSPVEISWPGKQKQEYVFGIPKGLEKVNGDTVLLIVPYNGEDPIRLPLGKISSLRRIKKSIFEV